MEPFSANEVASVLGVPLPATSSQEQLKTAKYAGLLSMEMEHRKTTILVNQFLGKWTHIREQCYCALWLARVEWCWGIPGIGETASVCLFCWLT